MPDPAAAGPIHLHPLIPIGFAARAIATIDERALARGAGGPIAPGAA